LFLLERSSAVVVALRLVPDARLAAEAEGAEAAGAVVEAGAGVDADGGEERGVVVGRVDRAGVR
jgi:hypothetical protein